MLLLLTVLFVCVHNAGRSQMAEALLNHHASLRGLPVRGFSAGTVGAGSLNPVAVSALQEVGVSVAGLVPKVLTPEMVDRADRLVSMGCGVACPAQFLVTEDWGLDDPAGQPLERVREIRDEIARRVSALLDEVS